MALSPQYAATPVIGIAQVSQANTARDGTGTLGTTIMNVLTGSANGTRIRRIEVQATGATAAGMVRLFLHDGTNTRLFLEVPITAITPSGTVAAFTSTYTDMLTPDVLPLTLPSTSWSIRATIHNTEASPVNVIVEGGAL